MGNLFLMLHDFLQPSQQCSQAFLNHELKSPAKIYPSTPMKLYYQWHINQDERQSHIIRANVAGKEPPHEQRQPRFGKRSNTLPKIRAYS